MGGGRRGPPATGSAGRPAPFPGAAVRSPPLPGPPPSPCGPHLAAGRPGRPLVADRPGGPATAPAGAGRPRCSCSGCPTTCVQWPTRPGRRRHRPRCVASAPWPMVVGHRAGRGLDAPKRSWPRSSSLAARGLLDVVVWWPASSCGCRCSGGSRASSACRPVGRFGYLVAQAVVPAFLSFIYIFARPPPLPTFVHSHRASG